jgi:hypothetical protein
VQRNHWKNVGLLLCGIKVLLYIATHSSYAATYDGAQEIEKLRRMDFSGVGDSTLAHQLEELRPMIETGDIYQQVDEAKVKGAVYEFYRSFFCDFDYKDRLLKSLRVFFDNCECRALTRADRDQCFEIFIGWASIGEKGEERSLNLGRYVSTDKDGKVTYVQLEIPRYGCVKYVNGVDLFIGLAHESGHVMEQELSFICEYPPSRSIISGNGTEIVSIFFEQQAIEYLFNHPDAISCDKITLLNTVAIHNCDRIIRVLARLGVADKLDGKKLISKEIPAPKRYASEYSDSEREMFSHINIATAYSMGHMSRESDLESFVSNETELVEAGLQSISSEFYKIIKTLRGYKWNVPSPSGEFDGIFRSLCLRRWPPVRSFYASFQYDFCGLRLFPDLRFSADVRSYTLEFPRDVTIRQSREYRKTLPIAYEDEGTLIKHSNCSILFDNYAIGGITALAIRRMPLSNNQKIDLLARPQPAYFEASRLQEWINYLTESCFVETE